MGEKYNNFLKRTATTIIGVFLAFLTIFWEGFPFFYHYYDNSFVRVEGIIQYSW